MSDGGDSGGGGGFNASHVFIYQVTNIFRGKTHQHIQAST